MDSVVELATTIVRIKVIEQMTLHGIWEGGDPVVRNDRCKVCEHYAPVVE
jgi:hypothetical protein